MLKKQLKDLVGKNKLEEVFEVLNNKITDTKIIDSTLLLSGRFSFIKDRSTKGIISFYEEDLELSKIRNSLLELVNQINEEEKGKNGHHVQLNASTNLQKEIILDDSYKDEDWGYIDFLLAYEKSNEETVNSLNKMNSYLNDLSDKMKNRTEQLNRLRRGNKKPNPTIVVKITEKLAEEMIDFVNNMDVEIEIFKNVASESIDSFYKTLKIAYESKIVTEVKELNGLYNSIAEYELSFEKAKESVLNSKNEFSKWPKIAKEINRARRLTEEIHDKIYIEFSSFAEKIKGLKENLKYTIINAEDTDSNEVD